MIAAMKPRTHVLIAAGLFLLGSGILASSQVPNFPQTLAANTVVGRLGTAGPSQAIPFATLASHLGGTVLSPATSTLSGPVCWNSTVGSLLKDCTDIAMPGKITMSAGAINERFATIVSGSTVNIGAATANYLQVTGTTTITAFDTVAAGIERTLEFAGILTLTHNSTTLILPAGLSITTAAGDIAIFRSEGSGNWRAVSYTRASGVSVAQIDTAAVATTAQYLANTSSKILTTDQVWAAGALTTLTDGATVTPDFTLGINFTWTLGATGRTLANPSAGIVVGKVITFFLVEDNSGSRTITTWGSDYKFSGGTKPTLTTTGNAVDRVQCLIRTTTFFTCSFTANFS